MRVRLASRILSVGVGAVAASYLGTAAALAEPRPPARGAAIVTGGSRGIGAQCCRRLAEDGFSVVVVYRSDGEAAANVVRDIEAQGGSAVAMQADVGEEQQVVKLFDDVDRWRGTTPLTALVNNAGLLGPLLPLSQLDEAAFIRLLKVNTVGPAICIREAERRMSTTGEAGGVGGAIVQVSSGSAYIGTPLAYATSKGGLNSLTIGLVGSLARQGIRINTSASHHHSTAASRVVAVCSHP